MSRPFLSTLSGKNVWLREIDGDDLGRIVTWRNDPEISKCFFTKKLSLKSQKPWFRRYLKDRSDLTYIIAQTEDSTICGMIALYNIDGTKAEVGRTIVISDHRGHGYAGEALSLILKLAFETLRLDEVYLSVYAWNKPAIKMYRKAGFKVAAKGDVLVMVKYRGKK